MFNPFKKYKEHDEEHQDITDIIFDLLVDVSRMHHEIKELREEVHYLVHFAEEAEDLDD